MLQNPRDMNLLGKIGYVMQSTANPGYSENYLGKLQEQKEREQILRERQQDRAYEMNKRKALNQALSNPEVLGSLSSRLGLPEELISQVGDIETLGALGRLTAGPDLPSSIREYQMYQQMSPQQQEEFLKVKRAQKFLDMGGYYAGLDPRTGQPAQTYDKTLAPNERPDTKYQQSEASALGTLAGEAVGRPTVMRQEYIEKGFQSLPKLQRSLQAKELRNEFIDDKIQKVANQANPWATGFTGSLASAVKGSAAYDLKANVDTLLANAGFDRLQEMRDNSPTGGALGQVSEREIALLQAAEQNLLQSQSYDQFMENLYAFREQRNRSLENIRQAYVEDYNRFGGKSDPNLKSPDEIFRTKSAGDNGVISLEDFLNE